jgi:hypothetical protein
MILLLCCLLAVETPPWALRVPEEQGYLYGVGSAQGQGALPRSDQSAKFEVLAGLRSRLQGTSRTSSKAEWDQSRGSQSGTAREEISTTVDASDLAGLTVVERVQDGNTTYSLARLDLARAQGDVDSRLAGLRVRMAQVPEGFPGVLWVLQIKEDLIGLERLAELLGGPDLRGFPGQVQVRLHGLQAQFPLRDAGIDLLEVKNQMSKKGFRWSTEGVPVSTRSEYTHTQQPWGFQSRLELSVSMGDSGFTLRLTGIGPDKASANENLQAQIVIELQKH